MQYTLRGISKALDLVLRERAKREGKSLNQVAIEMLAESAGLGGARAVRRPLDDVAGTWEKDAALERALEEQDRVDPDLWS